MKQSAVDVARAAAFVAMRAAGVPIRNDELPGIEVADFGLNRFSTEGACIFTMATTSRYSVKVIFLQPDQSLPEHWHPAVGDDPGKLETVRAIAGEFHLFTDVPDDQSTTAPADMIPVGNETAYTCRYHHRLVCGDQRTLPPGSRHWFKAGSGGAVLYSFSSPVRDLLDGFTDPGVQRATVIDPDR